MGWLLCRVGEGRGQLLGNVSCGRYYGMCPVFAGWGCPGGLFRDLHSMSLLRRRRRRRKEGEREDEALGISQGPSFQKPLLSAH